MITSRTPLRVSFLGGGTDFPSFFDSNPGYVLGTTINKYVYVSILSLPQFAEEKYRFTYRITESVLDYREFLHPVVREVLVDRGWVQPINVATMADLPGRSGLGSSSSFTVGFLNVLNEFNSRKVDPAQLAQDAVRIERELLREPGGWQDQYHAAVGGFKLYKFHAGVVSSSMFRIDPEFVDYVSGSMVMVPMQNWRDSGGFADITSRGVRSGGGNRLALGLANLTLETSQYLTSSNSLTRKFEVLGSAINEAWRIKVALSEDSLDPAVQKKISEGLALGATAGRLCGAGGTGFLLFLVAPDKRTTFIERMSSDFAFPVSVAENGSEIL